MSKQSETLATLADEQRRRVKLEIRTHTVGTVVSFNATRRRAVVTVDIKQAIRGDGDGDLVELDPIKLTDVPVQFPGGSLGGITWPLAAGDKVILEVQDRSLNDWLSKAGRAGLPRAKWTHALSDAIAYPTTIHAPVSVDMTGLVLDSSLLIKLGAGAASQAVKGTELQAALTAYTTAVATAGGTHAGIVPPTAISNGAFIVSLVGATAALAAQLSGILSTKVQVE